MSNLSPSEAAQLAQTIEMFEVITQSQPQDYQSLEILKEAYSKLGRDPDVIKTSKRIAEAYVQLGQLSSAILEYETILQRSPNDPDVLAALKGIESRANTFVAQQSPPETPAEKPAAGAPHPATPSRQSKKTPEKPAPVAAIDDGRVAMRKVFVDSKIISAGDFDLCWTTPDLAVPPKGIVDPFIQVLADKGILILDKSLKTLIDKSRMSYLPLDRYDADLDLTRTFPRDFCRRWCVLPFDRMSKTILVATANPFNQQAVRDIKEATNQRIVWYLASPVDLLKNLQKVFR
jgi:tetratricopeptide (TPR) repeat protein